MEEKYLQNLIDSGKQELESYNFYAQDFGLVNTLFIKKTLDKDNAHLFVQLAETKKLYLPIVCASFLLMYEKNYCEQSTNSFEVGDIIYDKKDRRSYRIEEKDVRISAENGYKLSCEYIDKSNKYEGKKISEGTRLIPYSYFKNNNFIKILCRSYRKYDFTQLLEFLKKHLDIEEVLADLPYKIAVICCKQELIKDLRNTNWHKAIPYRYLTKDGKKEDNLPIEPLIYIASDYQTIREHVFDKGKKLEAVIFFDKYNGTEIISKDIREGQLKKAIFIGEDNLEFRHENLLQWRWSTDEFCYFHLQDFSPAKITPIYVENPQLLDAINKFTIDIEEIEKQYTISLSALKYYAKKSLIVVVKKIDDSQINFLQESFASTCDEVLFNELYAAGVEKKDIDDYSEIFQDSYQNIIKEIQFSNNAKAKKIENFNFDYLVVSTEHKENWQQETTKNILTYSEWKINKDKNKKVLFLGLYGYSHYQTIKNSFDDISILIYADSQEQKAFEFYENKYNSEIEDEYHSNDRKFLSGLSYPAFPRTPIIDFATFDDIEPDNDTAENRRTYQREEIFLKFIFEDTSSEVLPISRHVLIQQDDILISEKLENIKVGDMVGVYHNFNKDKLEEIATPKQKQAISECKACAALWKTPLIKFYRSKNYYTKERLLADLQSKGADISHINTLNKWLDISDNTLFPSKARNIMAISELINDEYLTKNLPEISKKRKLYRSIMIVLGRDFSDAISQYITNKKRTDLLKSFSEEQIEKMLKENINFKKLIKITEPNAKEQLEQESLIFQNDSPLLNNENNQIVKGEDTVTNEEFEVLVKESEDLAKEAKEQADNLDDSIEELESDIKNKLDTVINENAQLKEQIEELREKLQQAENKIDSLGAMQIKHHEAIRQLIKSFTGLNTKVESLKSALK
jgi:hypothetical protein